MPGWVSDAVKPVNDKSVNVEIVWEPQWGMDMMVMKLDLNRFYVGLML